MEDLQEELSLKNFEISQLNNNIEDLKGSYDKQLKLLHVIFYNNKGLKYINNRKKSMIIKRK